MPDGATKPRKAPGRKDWSPEIARTLGRKGGEAKAAKRKLLDSLGLRAIASHPNWQPYHDAGEAYLRAQVEEVARVAGNGKLGPGASILVASSALQVSASRLLFEIGLTTLDPDLIRAGSKLAREAAASLQDAFDLARDCAGGGSGPPAGGGAPGAPRALPSLDEALGG